MKERTSTHNNQTKEIAAVIFEQRRFLIQIKQFVKQNLILKWKICVKHGFYRQNVRLATGVFHLELQLSKQALTFDKRMRILSASV